MKLSYLHIAAAVSYACGILSWFFFPLISISTGELKPRSLFVDEKAIMNRRVRPSVNGKSAAVDFEAFSNPIGDPCLLFPLSPSILHCRALMTQNTSMDSTSSSTISLIEIYLKSARKPLAKDASALVFPFPLDPKEENLRALLRFIIPLIANISSCPWLSKNIIILILPLDCASSDCYYRNYSSLERKLHFRSSDVLQNWLTDVYASTGTRNRGIHRMGVIRESFVFDLQEVLAPLIAHNEKLRIGGNILLIGRSLSTLPNLDLPSSLLALYPFLAIEHRQSPFSSSTLSFSIPQLPLTVPFFREYLRRLDSLFTFAFTLLEGTSGLHSTFRERNIDSMTIKLYPFDSKVASMSFASSQQYSPYELMDVNALHHLILDVIKISSSLYEKLHHSYNMYLIMSSQFFVPINEYALPVLLLTMPLLLFLWENSNKVRHISDICHAILYQIISAIVAVLLACTWGDSANFTSLLLFYISMSLLLIMMIFSFLLKTRDSHHALAATSSFIMIVASLSLAWNSTILATVLLAVSPPMLLVLSTMQKSGGVDHF